MPARRSLYRLSIGEDTLSYRMAIGALSDRHGRLAKGLRPTPPEAPTGEPYAAPILFRRATSCHASPSPLPRRAGEEAQTTSRPEPTDAPRQQRWLENVLSRAQVPRTGRMPDLLEGRPQQPEDARETAPRRPGIAMIRKLADGRYRLYSRKKNPKTGKRRNLGTFATRAAAQKHERAVQFFKRRG